MMDHIIRGDVNEEWAHSGYVIAGDFVFLSYCVGNIGQSVEEQVNGALDQMEQRLAEVNLNLSDVVQLDILMRDVWNIPVMEKVFHERFKGHYPARKTIQTDFAHVGGPDGLQVQIDGIAYKGKNK
jgi:2-iminobutanoate/2-iminopropanoate deaminase